ncbi:MAG: BMP family ABC transporter substrate-binding protein [Burkholderiaceae bacterium]|nr:MAG: BMP family ABC transporter substrate-binding protein [Burkholderiaceae bacterium]
MIDISKRNTLRLAAASAAGMALHSVALAAEPLKAAWIYVGPVGDGGWSFAHDNGRKAAQAKYGDRIKTSFVENVPEGADTERVARDLINQGNTLIYGTSFGFMEPLIKVAKDFPKVKFEHCTGYKSLPNLRTYEARNYEGAYLGGLVAGAMTKANQLGFVATVPIPEVLRNLNSFTLGALTTNPKVTVKVVWINDWVNPPKEAEAATTLFNGGADILFQNTDSPAVLKTAESMGKRAFGWDSDMESYGPKAHLASSIIDWDPYYIYSVGQVLDGTWKTGPDAWWGVKEGAIDLVGLAKDIPADVVAKVNHAKAGLKDGSFAIWKGPIQDNQGKEVLASGKVADDDFLRAIKFYVKGVEGKVPGGK